MLARGLERTETSSNQTRKAYCIQYAVGYKNRKTSTIPDGLNRHPVHEECHNKKPLCFASGLADKHPTRPGNCDGKRIYLQEFSFQLVQNFPSSVLQDNLGRGSLGDPA